MKRLLRKGLVPGFLLLCLVFGGASAGGYRINMALQLLAILILARAIVARRRTSPTAAGRRLALLAGTGATLGLAQLVPLPPGLWSLLPGRDAVAAGYAMLGLELPWLPISLAPRETLASLLWMLPAIAVLAAMLRLGRPSDRWLAWAAPACAAAGSAIGLLQVGQGASSSWYLYAVTDEGLLTGPFANAAHMAVLLMIAIPFLVARFLTVRDEAKTSGGGTNETLLILAAASATAAGIAFSASAVAVGLLVPVLIGSGAMIARRRLSPRLALAALGAGLVYVAVLANLGVGNRPLSEERLGTPNARIDAAVGAIAPAIDHFPFGSGLGTFAEIHRRYENPAAVGSTYLNHAHNDYVELAVEMSLAGIALMLVFLAWWGRSAAAIWRSTESSHIARAATIASAVLLLQSFVDYPLRTAALSALFAACCAIMAQPPTGKPRWKPTKKAARPARHLSAE